MAKALGSHGWIDEGTKAGSKCGGDGDDDDDDDDDHIDDGACAGGGGGGGGNNMHTSYQVPYLGDQL